MKRTDSILILSSLIFIVSCSKGTPDGVESSPAFADSEEPGIIVPSLKELTGNLIDMGMRDAEDPSKVIYWTEYNLGAAEGEPWGGYYTLMKNEASPLLWPGKYVKKDTVVQGKTKYTYVIEAVPLPENYRLPSADEFKWLNTTCKKEIVHRTIMGTGVNGVLFTNEDKGASIFLPIAPYTSVTPWISVVNETSTGINMHYWTSTPETGVEKAKMFFQGIYSDLSFFGPSLISSNFTSNGQVMRLVYEEK